MRASSTSVLPPNRRLENVEPQALAEPARVEEPKRGAPARAATTEPVPSARSARQRGGIGWFARAQLVTGVLVVVAASVLAAWGLRRYLYRSPRFAVRSVVVEGNARLGAHAVAQAGGVLPGTNVFTIDEGQVEARLRKNPWVAGAKVTKHLPDVVRVRVTEREARLVLALDGELWLVDHTGEIFKAVGDGDPTDFPVVTGIGQAELGRDREGVHERLRRVLDLLLDLEAEQVAARLPIQELRVDVEGRVTAIVGTEGVALELGLPPYRQKTQKARRIFGELAERHVRADVLFLDNVAHPERVVVRLRGGREEKQP